MNLFNRKHIKKLESTIEELVFENSLKNNAISSQIKTIKDFDVALFNMEKRIKSIPRLRKVIDDMRIKNNKLLNIIDDNRKHLKSLPTETGGLEITNKVLSSKIKDLLEIINEYKLLLNGSKLSNKVLHEQIKSLKLDIQGRDNIIRDMEIKGQVDNQGNRFQWMR